MSYRKNIRNKLKKFFSMPFDSFPNWPMASFCWAINVSQLVTKQFVSACFLISDDRSSFKVDADVGRLKLGFAIKWGGTDYLIVGLTEGIISNSRNLSVKSFLWIEGYIISAWSCNHSFISGIKKSFEKRVSYYNDQDLCVDIANHISYHLPGQTC